MARFYANENFRRQTVKALERLGHDVLTSLQAGNANLGIPDDEVLEFARSENRIVLTFNRRHFIKLHRENSIHPGIVVCTEDNDHAALAQRIHDAVQVFGENTVNQLIRVNQPNP